MVAYVLLFICLQNIPYVDSLTYVELYGISVREKEEPEYKEEIEKEKDESERKPL